ncbi:hypothetical protein [Conexibacter sp. SYSU D00693]|uniref:hypothetical protein n=1 Tax=Conexibacter sp. SYSU D00693 TaxID=2812560 RepID=UPI00196B64EB|nr:hypothetical protein [Conexibacter sp. SYSU D00693]
MIVAHAGHWIVNLMYALPVVIVGGLLGWQAIKDRRAERRELAAGIAPRPDDDAPVD